MESTASICRPVAERDAGTATLVLQPEVDKIADGFRWVSGVPCARDSNDVVVWEPDSEACCLWSISGGGLVVVGDEKGEPLGAYMPKRGERIEITASQKEQDLEDAYFESSLLSQIAE